MFEWAKRLNEKFEEYKKTGGTMRDLSRASGVPYDTVNKCMRGEVENPRGNSVVEGGSGSLRYGAEVARAGTWPKDLKIIGHVKAGVEGFFLDQGEHHGMAYRPPSLMGLDKAFAVYVQDESMSERYEPGDILWIHPTRPVKPGDYVVIELTDLQAFVKRLVRRTATHIECLQLNPRKSIKYPAKSVKRVYYVVGSYRED
jgi:SOS-response transcriptional repressor LexA